jgi:DNA replication protein DnaC
MSEYHVRYGGYGGIAYHHISDTYVALFTHFISCGEWVQVFGDEKLTTALLDRLGHHAHVLTSRGDSYRTRRREQKGGAEVSP